MDRIAGYLVIGVCSYEIVAMATGRAPTVSALCRRYRVVEAMLLAALLVHLHYEWERDAVLDSADLG